MSEDTDIVGDIFGWVGMIISTYFYISPAVPFYKLIKEEINYKDSPGFLLLCSFLNCILWADYGLLLDRKQIYVANGLGGTITIIWITIFLIFLCGKKFSLSLGANLIFIAAIVGTALLFFFIVPVEVTGYIAMIFNILMYAAPGEKIFRVFKTGNYSLIPIFSSVGGFLCSLCWFMYGLYSSDRNVIIPNGLGLFFAILQIIIFIIFYTKSKDSKNELNKKIPNNDE